MRIQRFALLFAGLTAGLSCNFAGAQELALVKDASKIEFVGSKPDGKHEGGFKKFEAAAIADMETPGRSSLNIQIDTMSLWSDDDKLTNHLKSPDFFDVRKHPSIIFESTEVIPGEEGKATIKGTMQMLGKAVEVEVPVEATVTEELIELDAKFEIDRTKWGMTYGQGKIDNTVKISAQLTFKR